MEIGIISFDSIDRELWVEVIVENVENIIPNDLQKGDYISINLKKGVTVDKLEPIHIVLIACLIEHLHIIGYKVLIKSHHNDVDNFFYKKLRIREYFEDKGTSYIESDDDKILNLWKIVDNEAMMRSVSITNYLNSKYFVDYDMSGFKNALDEVYANVADHSESNGNAYSYIHYDAMRRKICVAVCDFGLGIARTLRNAYPTKYTSDSQALRDSINYGISAKTNVRNRGFGLDSIVSSLSFEDKFRMVSNGALLRCIGGKEEIEIYSLDFDFSGSLIYFEISTESFFLRDIEEEIIIA